MRFIFYFLTIIFLFRASDITAKEYDLDSILELAEKNNKNLKLAESDLRFAASQRREAIATALPNIDLTMNYNRNFMENVFYFTVTDQNTGESVTQSFRTSFTNEYQMNAVLKQTIFGFGKVGNAIRAANYFKKQTTYNYVDQWQRIITDVKKAFYRTLLTKKVWEVAKQSESSAMENYENIKTKFESGVLSEFEMLQAEVRWMNSIPETMTARKNYELAVNNLKSLVDLPLREEVELVGNLETFPEMPDSVSQTKVFEERSDYNALLWQKKFYEKVASVQFSNHLPTLDGSLTYTYGARSEQFKLENENDNLFMGITLSVPLFSGGATSAKIQQARIDVDRATTRIHLAQDQIRIELQNILLRMKEANQRIQAASKGVESARRAFEIAETRVQNGLATQLELKDSRVFLDESLVNYYSAIYDYLDAYFDYQRATGKMESPI